MKMLMCGFAMSLSVLATDANAQQTVTVDGEIYQLSTLMENCQSITDDPAAQIACFSAISRLMEEQASGGEQNDGASVVQSFEALQAAAQYQNEESGLTVSASDCTITLTYFSNYFHISRRNISTIDLISAEFDASKLRFDQTVQVQGAQAPLFTGFMDVGANAATRGGFGLDSSLNDFEPRSAGESIDVFANAVVSQLPTTEAQTFDFILVHPERSANSSEIWAAFEEFVTACRAMPPSWTSGG